MEKFTRTIKSFIVRSGRVTHLQRNALDNYMGLHGIEFNPDEKLDFEQIFHNSNPTVIEIGFGDGTATHQMAELTPDKNYIAMDVYPPGVGALLDIVHNKNLTNVRVLSHDAAEVVETAVVDGTVSGFHIFFPDPWQKERHHKRRLIQVPFVNLLTAKLKEDGYIYCVTDWEDYANQMIDVFSQVENLKNEYDGFSPPIEWRPETSFEKKGLDKNHLIREIFVEKNKPNYFRVSLNYSNDYEFVKVTPTNGIDVNEFIKPEKYYNTKYNVYYDNALDKSNAAHNEQSAKGEEAY